MGAVPPDRAASGYERKDTSWVLEAIEREAMARATRQVLLMGPVTMCGLSAPQVAFLIADYERRTGRMARDIDPQTET